MPDSREYRRKFQGTSNGSRRLTFFSARFGTGLAVPMIIGTSRNRAVQVP
jgi:hypothetical protein